MATQTCSKITLHESSRHAAKLVCIISTMCSLEKALDKCFSRISLVRKSAAYSSNLVDLIVSYFFPPFHDCNDS